MPSAEQRVVAFKGGYVVGLAEPHHQGRTDRQVASDHGYIEEAIAVEVSWWLMCVERAFQSSKEWRVHPPEAFRRNRVKAVIVRVDIKRGRLYALGVAE